MSERAAKFLLARAQDHDFETELLDVRDFVGAGVTKGMAEEPANRWQEIAARADGFIVVAPEYNNGYPGELKLWLDQLYSEYANKAVAICGVSAGWGGGIRVVKQLVMIMHQFKMFPIRNALYFPSVQDLISEEGEIGEERYEKNAATMFEELVWLAEALKAKRES